MKSALFDTNILIDALHEHPEPFVEFGFWDPPFISAITLIELHTGASPDTKRQITKLIDEIGFQVIHTDNVIIEIAARIRAASLRRRTKIALPDAVILATALARRLIIVTRNKKDFRGPNVRIPYEMETVTTTRIINIQPPPA